MFPKMCPGWKMSVAIEEFYINSNFIKLYYLFILFILFIYIIYINSNFIKYYFIK